MDFDLYTVFDSQHICEFFAYFVCVDDMVTLCMGGALEIVQNFGGSIVK